MIDSLKAKLAAVKTKIAAIPQTYVICACVLAGVVLGSVL